MPFRKFVIHEIIYLLRYVNIIHSTGLGLENYINKLMNQEDKQDGSALYPH